jgi:hypothetical protein
MYWFIKNGMLLQRELVSIVVEMPPVEWHF